MRTFFSLCIAMAALGQTPQLPEKVRDQMMEARLSRMTSPQRIVAIEALLKQSPGKPSMLVLLAQSFLERMRETTDYGYADRAQKLIEGVLQGDAANYDALRVQNEIDLLRHEFGKVAARSRILAQREPKDAVNWATLGDALMETGQYSGAADAYQQMLNLRGGLMSFNRVGWYRWVTGDAAGAIDMMQRAVNAGRPSEETTAWCLVELGHLQFKTGKAAEAAATYQRAIDTFPRMHSAWAGLGNALAAVGKTREAIDAVKKAQSMAPLVEYAGLLADLYSIAGDAPAMQRQLEMVDIQAKMEAASGVRANRQLALIYANHQRNLKDAVEIAEADLAVRKDVFTWDAYAWVLYRAGRLQDAVRASQQALRANTPEALFYYHAGMIAKANGDTPTATELLSKAIALNSKFDVRESARAAAALAELRAD